MNPPQALGRYIFIQRDPYKPTTEGGVLIPECADRTPRFAPTVLATVVSCGKACREPKMKPGARVAVKQHAGDDILFGDTTYTRIREWDIVGFAI
jgi:co-chaperonin GroES (HSP10)